MSWTVNDPQIPFAFAAMTKCSDAGGDHDQAVPSPSRRIIGKSCNFLNNVGSWPVATFAAIAQRRSVSVGYAAAKTIRRILGLAPISTMKADKLHADFGSISNTTLTTDPGSEGRLL